MVGILLQAQLRPICLLSVYLPTRTGCTDTFKESLDYLDSIINLFGFDNDVFILGDINADLGLGGGPMASTPINEQGKILMQYLKRWNFLSAHLHLSPTPETSTYESEAHGSISTIDHIICLPNNSDHLPITCHISTHLPTSLIHHKKCNPPPRPNWRKLTTRVEKILYIPTRSQSVPPTLSVSVRLLFQPPPH